MLPREKFDWDPRSDLPEDVDLFAFQSENNVREFNWGVAVWWNTLLADAAERLRLEQTGTVTGLLPESWVRDLTANATQQDIDIADDLIGIITSRVPRSEKRCVDHLEHALSHVLRSVSDVAKSPWMVYDAETGIWRQEGQWMSSRNVGLSVGSVVDEVIGRFESAMHRAIDLCDALVELAAPDAPKPGGGANNPNVQAWQANQDRRKRLKDRYKDARDMAREIPRGKYRVLKSSLKDRLAVEQTWWDSEPRYLVLKDGVLDLADVVAYGRTTLLEFSPFHASTMALDVALSEAQEEGGDSEWARGVRKLIPDAQVRRHLQKRYGAALLGQPSVAGKTMVWQYGVKDTGKSTIQECVAGARGVFAPYSLISDADALTEEGKKRGASERMIAYARGKRFVVIDEINDGDRLDAALLKKVTGGGTVSGTAKYANSVEYFFTATIFMASNHPPTYPPGDTALAARIQVVPFAHRMWVRSRNPDEWEAAPESHRADEQWKEQRILPIARERAAVLRWVLDGLIAYSREGFAELPDAMEEARQEFASDADPVGTLVRSLLGEEPGYEDGAWLKIYTDSQWEAEGLRDGDGVTLARVEDLLNARARDLGLIRMGDVALSKGYLRAAKTMLHELGGMKKKARVEAGRNGTQMVYSRMRDLTLDAMSGGGAAGTSGQVAPRF